MLSCSRVPSAQRIISRLPLRRHTSLSMTIWRFSRSTLRPGNLSVLAGAVAGDDVGAGAWAAHAPQAASDAAKVTRIDRRIDFIVDSRKAQAASAAAAHATPNVPGAAILSQSRPQVRAALR